METSCNDSLLDGGNAYYDVFLKISIGTMCTLSAFGSSLIILTFILFKDIRTIPRQLLFNLSIADLLTALSNFSGIFTNFDKYLNYCLVPLEDQNAGIQSACIAQAATGQLTTNSSILWTICIAFYMLIIIVFQKESIAKKLLPLYYILSWGLPFAVTVWFSFVGYLGYDPETTPGWCGIVGSKLITDGNFTHKEKLVFPVVIGYTGFVYAAFFLLPIMYIVIRCHIKILFKRRPDGKMRIHLQAESKSTDLKMIFIPLIFIFIRVWSLVVDSFDYYVDRDLKYKFKNSTVGAIFVLAKGLGDSSQGFANAILFIGFTQAVRWKLWRPTQRAYKRYCRCCRHNRDELMMSRVTEATPLITDDSTGTVYATENINDSCYEANKSFAQ